MRFVVATTGDEKMTENIILDFCMDAITGVGGLHDYEYYEMATPKAGVDREIAVAVWIVKCLANDKSNKAQAVVDAIVERRQNREPAAPGPKR